MATRVAAYTIKAAAALAGDGSAASILNRAVRDALRDALPDYEARELLVVTTLESRREPDAPEEPLYQAVYTLFRGVPARVPPGMAIYISTRDRAGGEVELVWETRERPRGAGGAPGGAHAALREGPYGDLFELALLGLEAICRGSIGLRERAGEEEPTPTTSSIGREVASNVRRRYVFVLPGRAPSS